MFVNLEIHFSHLLLCQKSFLSWSPPCFLCVCVKEWRHNLSSSIPTNGQRVHCQHVDLGYYIYCVYIPHPLLHNYHAHIQHNTRITHCVCGLSCFGFVVQF